MANLATSHDAVASALDPGEDESPEILTEMMNAVIEGLHRSDVDRLVWTGGADGLKVGPETLLIETDDFPERGVAYNSICS